MVDGRNYAVKKLNLKGNIRQQDKIIREVLALSRLQHMNVVRYFTAWLVYQVINFYIRVEGSNSFEDSDSESSSNSDDESVNVSTSKILYIQMELCEAKTLRHLIDSSGTLPDDNVFFHYQINN